MISAGVWYLGARVAMGPEGMGVLHLGLITYFNVIFLVIWTRRNPAPWMTIDQNETAKLGTKLGTRLDASGTPQRIWEKRFVVI